MELSILQAIQSISNPFFDILFEIITMAGEQLVVIMIFCAIYWLYDKELGHYMGFTIATSLLFNTMLKAIFNLPRPIGKPGIRSLRTETAIGSSFPSGHSQNAASTYFAPALWIRKRWLWITSTVIMSLVGLSRLYLGVHYPKDVVVGLVLGVLCAVLCKVFYNRIKNFNFAIFALNVVAVLMVIFSPTEDIIKVAGLAFGMLVGFPLEQRFIAFNTDLTWRKKTYRYVVGIIIVVACYIIPKLLVPYDIPIVWYIRYALVTLSISVFAPFTFTKLKF